MLLLLILATLIGLPVVAAKGHGYRGLYIALAIAAAAFGMATMALADTPIDLASASPETIRGAQFIDDYGPFVGGWLLSVALAAAISAALYRPRLKSLG